VLNLSIIKNAKSELYSLCDKRNKSNIVMFEGSIEQCEKVGWSLHDVHSRAVDETISRMRRIKDEVKADRPLFEFPVYVDGKLTNEPG